MGVEIIHLEIDGPGLTATNSPLPIDDEDGDSTNATLAGFLDLVFDRLSVRVRIEICDCLG